MTNDSPALAPVLPTNDIPLEWRAEVQAQLQRDETVLAVLEVDLDTRLFFVNSLVLVTNQRLLSRAGAVGVAVLALPGRLEAHPP